MYVYVNRDTPTWQLMIIIIITCNLKIIMIVNCQIDASRSVIHVIIVKNIQSEVHWNGTLYSLVQSAERGAMSLKSHSEKKGFSMKGTCNTCIHDIIYKLNSTIVLSSSMTIEGSRAYMCVYTCTCRTSVFGLASQPPMLCTDAMFDT